MPEVIKNARLYDVFEAASITGEHPNTVRKNISNGVLKGTRLGRNLFIEEDDLKKYLIDKLGLQELSKPVLNKILEKKFKVIIDA